MKIFTASLVAFIAMIHSFAFAQIYPDALYEFRIDSLYANIETSVGVRLSTDGKSIVLQENASNGYFILSQQTSQHPFDYGLPSWNGSVQHNSAGFKVEMRFQYNSGWSPWMTVGFWKNNIWSSYGSTSFAGGFIDYDYVKLNYLTSKWQYKVTLTRSSISIPSPSIHKMNFFVSDSRTTANITQIVADNPAQIFIPTNFIYQYSVDPVIGGSICSPTTVAMILSSYSIQVDPYQFALTTKDPYYGIFGIWPRAVQHAAEYGLDGAVTRYRTWSEAREVLANGGRVAMSLGSPLYPNGHLAMLAGFTSNGGVITHDPAKSNGYSYVHNKTSLSQSWFNKGGVAYTFYNNSTVSVKDYEAEIIPDGFHLYQNYPNPFNPGTIISFSLPQASSVSLKVFNSLGEEIATLIDNEFKEAGFHTSHFSISNSSIPAGFYIYKLTAGSFIQSKKMILLQ